jgi:hypothetical protein
MPDVGTRYDLVRLAHPAKMRENVRIMALKEENQLD